MRLITNKILSLLVLAAIVVSLILILDQGRFNLSASPAALPTLEVSGAVVPHHNIVASQRTQFFTQLAERIGSEKFPETIILLSPNHYFAGKSKIQTTGQDWQLGEGQVNANTDVVADLIASGLVTNEPGSFTDEHGIYNILNDIHNTFPKARLVPLILKDASQPELAKLEQVLQHLCNKCLMVSSVDFSHYLPAILADLHDQKSIRDLQTLNTADVIKNAEVDSGAALALLTMWARSHDTHHFNLKNHTNSDLLLSNPDLEGTSHMFGWYESGQPVEPEKFISFVVSKSVDVGIEGRAIWGTDLVLTDSLIESVDPDKMLIAGKVTEYGVEFFGLPLDGSNLVAGSAKQKALNQLYEPYQEYLVSSPSGQAVKIPLNSSSFDFNHLSSTLIQSKIKSVINLNP